MFTPFVNFPNVIFATSTVSDRSIKNDGVLNQKNIDAFAKKLGIGPKQIVFMNQVHSGTVSIVEDVSSSPLEQTDGLITAKNNVFLGVLTADCLPIAFFDPEHRIVSIIHAGYRGLLANIIPSTISIMQKQFATDPRSLQVAIGPSIQKCCYNIDEKRIDLFTKLFPSNPEILEKREGKIFLDLQMSAKLLLLSSMVNASNIQISTVCTRDSSEYFSYRRDPSPGNGMVTVIGTL